MDYYEEFGVSRSATPDQIRQAHKTLARLVHPDQFQDPELKRLAECQMKRVNEMHAVLSDPRRRREYDDQLPPPFRRYREQAGWIAAAVVALVWMASSVQSSSSPAAQSTPRISAAAASGQEAKPASPRTPVVSRRRRPPPEREASESERKFEELSRESGERGQPTLDAPPPVTPLPIAPLAPLATIERTVPEPKGLAGRWFYPRPSRAPATRDLYPPEYIEAAILEDAGTLRGRYRSRYKVADRAISPEVNFRFEGAATGDAASLPWAGDGGSRGEVRLRLVSSDSIEVRWFATELGNHLGLASGTAVLVRVREP